MPWYTLLSALVIVSLLFHSWFVARRRIIFGAETLFLGLGAGTFFATLAAALRSGQEAHPYVAFVAAGLVAFTLGTAICSAVLEFHHRKELRRFIAREWQYDLAGAQLTAVVSITCLAIVVTFAYFFSLGYLVPIEAARTLLRAGAGGMNLVYNELRASTRSGSYLGLGYVSQFKDCLLPLVTVIVFVRMKIRATVGSRTLFAVLLVATVLGAIGTGSRYNLASFAAVFGFVGLAPFMKPFRFSKGQVAVALVAGLAALSILTAMMGTRGQKVHSRNPVLWAPLLVLDRICISPANERFLVYERYLKGRDPMWGKGTIEQLRIALPGRAEYTLSNRLHQLLYGSPYGDVGLDVWGSLWYDFHWYGLFLAALMGASYHWFYVVLLRGPKLVSRTIVLTYAAFVLGLATDLLSLILHGFVTLLIFLVATRLVRKIAEIGRDRMPSRASTVSAGDCR